MSRRRHHRSRGYSRRDHDRYGYGHRGHGRGRRHDVSPGTRLFTTVAIWAIIIFALANGAVSFTGK